MWADASRDTAYPGINTYTCFSNAAWTRTAQLWVNWDYFNQKTLNISAAAIGGIYASLNNSINTVGSQNLKKATPDLKAYSQHHPLVRWLCTGHCLNWLNIYLLKVSVRYRGSLEGELVMGMTYAELQAQVCSVSSEVTSLLSRRPTLAGDGTVSEAAVGEGRERGRFSRCARTGSPMWLVRNVVFNKGCFHRL